MVTASRGDTIATVHFHICLAAFLFMGCRALAAAGPQVATSYVPYHFAPDEGWRVIGGGDIGDSRIDHGRLLLDFTHGASWVGVAPPDRVLLGNVGKIRIRMRGAAETHPVHLYLRTHFMTFHKIGAIEPGAMEVVFDGPPGNSWQWESGENDGRIHGPIRVGNLRFEANSHQDRSSVELTEITVEGLQPANRLCVMTAQTADQVELRCMGPSALSGELNWIFRDWNGNQLGRGHQPVSVPAAAQPLTIPVAAPPGSTRKFVEAEFQVAIADQEIAPVHACWTAGQASHTDSGLHPESPFGMGVYLDRYSGADLERAASIARDAGVKWSREGFSWGRIEHQRGSYDWSYYDNLVATAKRHGISIYGLVSGWAPWTKPYSPQGIDDYLAFVKELVRHYHADIHHWEIWNEPNIFFWQGPKEMYAELLRRSYAAVKEADPAAQVLGMLTSGIDYNFIARTMALDAPFDILTIHPYRKVLNDRALINELRIVADLVKGRPVWITEFGWTTLTPHNTLAQDFAPFTERQQAELLARAYLCTLVAGVGANTSWYDFRNDGDDPLYFENEMGILRRDFTPKPAYWAYATLTRVLESRQLVGPVDAGDGVLAYRFAGHGSTIALWSPEGDRVATLLLKSGAKLVNTIGEESSLPPGNARIELHGSAPVYVIESLPNTAP